MAILDLPNGTHISGLALLFSSPGQSRLTYPYTGQIDIISRAPTVLYGTVTTITEMGREREFLAFAQALNGAAGAFRIPLAPSAQYAPQAHTSASSALLRRYEVDAVDDNGVITISPVVASGSEDWTPRPNDWINIAKRLVRVVTVPSATGTRRITTAPHVAAEGQAVEVKAPYVVARLDGQSAFSLSTTGTGNDVQTVGWVEVVGAE